MIRTLTLILILSAAICGFAEEQKASACPDGKPVAADQVPAAAVAALTKLAGGTAPTEYHLCVVDGKNIYCVMQKGADGKVAMLAVGADGAAIKDCGECCEAKKPETK